MKQITVTYNPIRWFRWWIRKRTGEFPQNWGDVNAKHLIAIACLYKQSISEEKLLAVFSGIPVGAIKKLDEFHRYKLSELISFVADPRPVHELIIKKVLVGKKQFIAPKPKLKGLPFGQFIFIDTWFGIFQQTQKPEDLARFIASLYCPAGEAFDEDKIEEYAILLQKASPLVSEAIVINWQLIHEWLNVSYPLIFQRAADLEKKDKSSDDKAAAPDQNRWIKIFNNLVGDEVLDRDRWAQTPTNVVFEYMTRKYKEMIKRRKSTRKL